MSKKIKWADRILTDTTIIDGTAEGIADHIDDTHKHTKTYRVANNELGGLFNQLKGTKRNNVDTLLSQLYYGEYGSTRLSKRGSGNPYRNIPHGLYVTMFSGIQEPWLYIDEKMVRQGLVRRMLVLYVEKGGVHRPPLDPKRKKLSDFLSIFAKEIGRVMCEYHKQAKGELIELEFDEKARTYINEVAKKLDEDIDNSPTNLNIVRQSLWEHAAKLAMCRKVGMGDDLRIGVMRDMNVTLKEINLVQPMMNHVEMTLPEIVTRAGEERGKVKVYEEPLEVSGVDSSNRGNP